MTDATVAADFLKTLDIERDLSSEITFHRLRLIDHGADSLHLIVRQIPDTGVGADLRLCKDTVRTGSAYPVNISQTDLNTFLDRKSTRLNSSHIH